MHGLSPARRAHSSKPAEEDLMLWDKQTDRRTDTVAFHRPCPHTMRNKAARARVCVCVITAVVAGL